MSTSVFLGRYIPAVVDRQRMFAFQAREYAVAHLAVGNRPKSRSSLNADMGLSSSKSYTAEHDGIGLGPIGARPRVLDAQALTDAAKRL